MKKIIAAIFFILGILYFFPQLTSLTPVSGGDYITYWPANYNYFTTYVFSAWDPKINLGWSTVGLMHYDPYSFFIGVVGNITKSNIVTEKILLWLPFIILSSFSITRLFRKMFPDTAFWPLSSIIYLVNTYSFMMVGGGQLTGIGFAYAVAPLVFLHIFEVFEKKQTKEIIRSVLTAGIFVSLQVMFDLRVTYITLLGIALYLLMAIVWKRLSIRNILFAIGIPVITLLLHAFWIMPLFIFRQNPIEQFGSDHASIDSLRFFSFAKLENAISLLHPNWPENIFGKVSFMQAEFLVLPIVAFSSLLFISLLSGSHSSQTKQQATGTVQQKQRILYFTLLGLGGAFLAKGVNEPFGIVYLWLFEHVPGFIMFRDPTKWYLLVSLSYAMLTPFALNGLKEWMVNKKRFKRSSGIVYHSLLFLFILFWLYTCRPAVTRELTGTFTQGDIPQQYKDLQTFLAEQPQYFRVLWVPQPQRYGYISVQQSALNAAEMYNVAERKKLYAAMAAPASREFMKEAGIKYVIVPEDTRGEIFLEDRKYSEKVYKDAVAGVSAIPWLSYVGNFGKIRVYENEEFYDRIHLEDAEIQGSWMMLSPVHYQIVPKNGTIDGRIIFSERYDPGWIARYDGKTAQSQRYKTHFNSFVIRGSSGKVDIYYLPQQWVDRGLAISGISLFIVLMSLIAIMKERRK